MISDRAKRLVEALQNWRSLELAYEIAQKFLDEEASDALSHAYEEWPRGSLLSERIAQTRGHNGEDE